MRLKSYQWEGVHKTLAGVSCWRSGDGTKVIPVGGCTGWCLVLECLSLCKQQTIKESGGRRACACSSLHTNMVLFLRMKAISSHAL